MRNGSRKNDLRQPRPNGFVLLEVLISVVILAISVTAILRSFTLSLEAASRAEVINTATLLAETLVEEIQISPPATEKAEGPFGSDYPDFFYRLEFFEEEIDYKSVKKAREVTQFRPLKRFHLDVIHKGRRGDYRAVSIDSAIMGLQKFSDAALVEYHLFDLD